GLRDDTLRIRAKLGVEPEAVLELNAVFRARGYRKDMGVKAAVAVLFGQRFAKSKKAATSNWSARTLSESQILYAANDAWAARRAAQALGLGWAGPSSQSFSTALNSAGFWRITQCPVSSEGAAQPVVRLSWRTQRLVWNMKGLRRP